MKIKKVRGGFLRSFMVPICGYLSRGRGVKCARCKHGEFFKTRNLTCKLVSIGGLTILFLILGGRGKPCKT
jgi:hypothetical protein